jgi:hypothetical protein
MVEFVGAGEEWMWSGDACVAQGAGRRATQASPPITSTTPTGPKPLRGDIIKYLPSQNYLFLEPENEECTNYIVLLIRRYRMLL